MYTLTTKKKAFLKSAFNAVEHVLTEVAVENPRGSWPLVLLNCLRLQKTQRLRSAPVVCVRGDTEESTYSLYSVQLETFSC